MRRTLLATLSAAGLAVLVTFVIIATTSPDELQPSNTGDAAAASPTAPGATRDTEAASPTVAPSANPTAVATSTPTATPIPPTEAERYRAALEARDQGDLEIAAQQLEAITQTGGTLALFAQFRLAQVLAVMGDDTTAVEAFAAATTDDSLPASLRSIARREGAASLAALDRFDEAVEWLSAVVDDPTAGPSERTTARWERAQILLELQDPAWADDALAIVSASAGHPSATLALDELEAAEVDAPALSAAYARYLARENGSATERYEAILADDATPADAATAAIAWFYLGALAERVPDREGAIEAYGESLAADAFGSRADDAAYWRGRVAEEDGDFMTAAASYDLLVSDYPASRFASDAALRGALAVMETGNEAGALDRLAAIANGPGAEAAAAARWYDLLAGSEAREQAGVRAASEIDARSLAAILEQAGAAALDAPPIETLALSGGSSDLETIDGWLTAEYGLPAATTALDEELFDDISPALIEAGERVLARALMLEHLDVLEGEPHAQIELSRRASELGLDDVALIAAIRLLSPLPTETRLGTPVELERLAYPAPWSELVIAASEEFEVPPLLLLALIRQESAFEPDVISPAGAIGLTQVIPPTGVLIAAALDESWDGPASLTRPETSLRYGAAYLSAQLETFDGNMFAALAAYNAGPTNAQRWLDAQVLDGPDGYVQTIDFEETRRYVTSVVEQYAWYRYLYGAAEAPAIR